MRDRNDFNEAEEGLFHTWFTAFRDIVPAPRRDLSKQVLQRLEVLRQDRRLEAPTIDHVLSRYLIETVNLLLDWFTSSRDDKKR